MNMTVSQLKPNAAGLLLLFSWIVFLLTLYDLISLYWIKREKSSRIAGSILLVLSFVMLQLLMQQRDGIYVFSLELPVFWAVMIEVLICLLVGIQQIQKNKWLKVSLSSMSIKEALDSLPTGLLFFRRDGMPCLVNEQMNRICRDAFHMPLRNGVEFTELLYHGAMEDKTDGTEKQILQLSDKSVFSFNLSSVTVANRNYYELVASDISQEWQLKKELEEQQKKAKQINIRLKSLLDTIEYVTMSKELLQFKTTLHDNIGRSLLYAKRWLLSPKKVNKAEMLELFRTNIRGLHQEEPEQWQTPYYIIEKQAKQLGIELIIDGKLPETEENLISLIDTAISVQMTNVLRHAEGSKVMIRVTEWDGSYALYLTNDGKAPSGKVVERGGLTNLRRETELVGGTMEVRSEPEFVLLLKLPKKTNETEEDERD